MSIIISITITIIIIIIIIIILNIRYLKEASIYILVYILIESIDRLFYYSTNRIR